LFCLKNKNMEFNIEKALETKTAKTLDGRKVIIAGYNPNAEDFEQLLGWIEDKGGTYSQSWFANGTTISDKENVDNLIS